MPSSDDFDDIDSESSGFTWFPDTRTPRWSHTSGWMLLSGERRHLSCVIPVRDQAASLGRLLPAVSDALTESGFPWEIVVVDAGGGGTVPQAVRRFSEIASLRIAVSAEPVSRARALLTGMAGARGDAVLLVDTEMESGLWRVPRMIERWTDGAAVVSAGTGAARPTRDGDWEPADDGAAIAIDTRDFGIAEGCLVLLDRSVADRLAAGA